MSYVKNFKNETKRTFDRRRISVFRRHNTERKPTRSLLAPSLLFMLTLVVILGLFPLLITRMVKSR